MVARGLMMALCLAAGTPVLAASSAFSPDDPWSPAYLARSSAPLAASGPCMPKALVCAHGLSSGPDGAVPLANWQVSPRLALETERQTDGATVVKPALTMKNGMRISFKARQRMIQFKWDY